MNDLRTAAQRALEALNKLYLPGELERVNAAITALRAALAQQDEPLNLRDPAVQKRLATQWGYVPAAQAEPVEPVAYIHRQGNYWDTSERHLTDDEKARGWTEEPLYTTPPQRKPLTEEKIDVTTAQERDALLDHIYEYGTAAEGVLERIRKLCRAVERAHGIKE